MCDRFVQRDTVAAVKTFILHYFWESRAEAARLHPQYAGPYPGLTNKGRNAMQNRLGLSTFLVTALLSGCAVHQPQTADEFRSVAPGATFGKHDSFSVKRRFDDVAKTFETQAYKCLDQRIQMTESGYKYHHVVVTKYTPTVLISENSAELHLQFEHEQGVVAVSEMPEKGYYLMVADATRVDENTTQIDMYRPSVGHQAVVTAVKGWATGENLGCPDMTK